MNLTPDMVKAPRAEPQPQVTAAQWRYQHAWAHSLALGPDASADMHKRAHVELVAAYRQRQAELSKDQA